MHSRELLHPEMRICLVHSSHDPLEALLVALDSEMDPIAEELLAPSLEVSQGGGGGAGLTYSETELSCWNPLLLQNYYCSAGSKLAI